MLYQTYQAYTEWMAPARMLAEDMVFFMQYAKPGPADSTTLATLNAACEVFSRARMTHARPAFNINKVKVGEKEYRVREDEVFATPFSRLLRFKKVGVPDQPRVLIVAPMSGHFATLLRDTVRTMLADHEVYVTDWANARDVPLSAGPFGMDEYVEHLIWFLEKMGPGSHMVAICQPCVAALAATAIMAEDNHAAQPKSLTLMAGPIDCRVNPTEVNRLATSKPMKWFEDNMIERVPIGHAGTMRRVYPGFLQLGAFMSMNLPRHMKAFAEMYRHLTHCDNEKAQPIASFYAEYFAVADLPAEFYLETVKKVFQEYDLPLGKLTWRGRLVKPEAIRRTALLTVEGERDDICALGQTVAAQDLCSRILPFLKHHHVQTGVGHYGVFSGRRWQTQIYPRVRALIHQSI